MAKRLPARAYRELRLEMRGHVEALVAAYQELGGTRDEAVLEALRRFGDEQALRRDWLGTAVTDLRGWGAAACGATAALCTMAAGGALALGAWMSASTPLELLVAGPLLPVTVGLFLGSRAGSPRRPVLRVILFLLATAGPAIADLPAASAPLSVGEIVTRFDLCFVAAGGTWVLRALAAAWEGRSACRRAVV
jgi:hypothetical protein